MEVVVPSPSPPGSPSMDPFDFHGARISPYLSAPPSPKRFGEYYMSAPTSPSRLTDFYSDFDHYLAASPSNDDDGGFAFSVGGETEKPSRSAEELFDGGKIKPMTEQELFDSSRSPLLSPGRQQPKRSALGQGKKAIREALSPRRKKDSENDHVAPASARGRDRTPAAAAGSTSRRVTRSHSPYRVSHYTYTWEEEQNVKQQAQSQHQSENKKEDPMRGSLSSKSTSRKWRLRDFLLFRSASEGRGTSKDPFRKYPASFRKTEEAGKASRRKEGVSAHELHYARKKAESEDLKKRTFLPYKQGILGRLAGFAL